MDICTLLGRTYAWMEKKKKTLNVKVRTTHWREIKLPVLQVIKLSALKSTSHAGGLSEKKYLDYLQDRKRFANSGQSGCWTPNFNSYSVSFHQPNCFRKYKRLAASGRAQTLVSHRHIVQALSWCSFSIAGCHKKFGVIKQKKIYERILLLL